MITQKGTYFIQFSGNSVQDLKDSYLKNESGKYQGHENIEKAIVVGKRFLRRNSSYKFQVLNDRLDNVLSFDKNTTDAVFDKSIAKENLKMKIREL